MAAVAQHFDCLQTSTVTDDLMDEWVEEVNRLKPSKRPKWKGALRNQTGVASIVRYVPEGVRVHFEACVCVHTTTHFVHKLSEERKRARGTELDWLPVLRHSDLDALRSATLCETDGGKKLLVVSSPPSALPVLGEPAESWQGASGSPVTVFFAHDAAILGDAAQVREQIEAQIRANATGNHTPRGHPIHVPTAPGQPVRG